MSVTDRVAVGIQVVGAETSIAQLTAVKVAVQSINQQKVAIATDMTGLRSLTTEASAAQTAVKAINAEKVAPAVDISQVAGARAAVQGLQGDMVNAGTALSKLAAPVALTAGIVGLTRAAADYQTLITTTANNTTLATDEIKTMDQTIRALPSGAAPLQDLATGFKNITDLGYGAASAQTIAMEASKAATETGANQATTMLAISSAMKEYNATAAQTGAYSNTVTEAAKLGNSTLTDWTENTRRATAIAANFGVPLQEVDAAMVALTRHGFDTATSQTQVAALLQHIVAPSQAAQKELAKLSQTTGIDLVHDFSLAGLQAVGLSGVLDDLARATRGSEDEIYKVIPATRGGQGALALTGQAYGDFQSSLADLSATMDGSLKPIEEGFARTTQTAGYQWGQFTKQLKFDAIDAGQGILPLGTAVTSVLDKIPGSAVAATAQIGLLAVGMKAAGSASELFATAVSAVRAPQTAIAQAAVADAAALQVETAAINTETEALLRLDAARASGALSLSGQAAAEKDMAALQESIASRQAGIAALGEETAGATAAGTAAGSLIIPVVAAFALEKLVIDPLANQIKQGLEDNKPKDLETTVNVTVKLAQTGTTTADQLQQQKLLLQGVINQANAEMANIKQQMTTDATTLIDPMSGATASTVNDAGNRQLMARYQQTADTAAKAQTQLSALDKALVPATLSDQTSRLSQLNDEVKRGQLTAAEAERQWEQDGRAVDNYANQAESLSSVLQSAGADQQTINNFIADGKTKLEATAQANADAKFQADQTAQALRDQGAAYLAMGASAEAINGAVYGKDSGQSAAQIAQDKKDIAELSKAFTDSQTSIDKIDFTKPIATLTKEMPALEKAQGIIAKTGQVPEALSALTALGGQFLAIADAENQADASFNAYMDDISGNIDPKVKALDNLKTKIDEGVKQAQTDKDLGIAKPDEIALLDSAANAYGHIAQIRGQIIAQGEIPDILGAIANLPNFGDQVQTEQQMTKAAGGLPAVTLQVNTTAQRARDEIQAVANGDYTAVIHTTVDTSGSTYLPNANNPAQAISGYASGTGGADAGWAWVGENGPELVRFHGGERVMNARQSAGMGGITRGYDSGTDDAGGATGGSGTTDASKPVTGPGAAYYQRVGNQDASKVETSANKATGAVNTLNSSLATTASTLIDIGNRANVFAGVLTNLNSEGLKAVSSELDKQLTINKQIAEQGLPSNATAAQKASVDQGAEKQAVDTTIAFGQAVAAARDPAADLSGYFQRIRDSGAANADNLIRQVSIMREINVSTAAIAADQQRITDLDNAHNLVLEQRKQADTASSRAKTEQGWQTQAQNTAIQNAQRLTQYQWTLDQARLDDTKTAEERNYQDATTNATRLDTLQMRSLTDQLTAMTKLQTTANSGNSALEQSLSSQMASSSGSAKFQTGELLSIQKDYDSRNRQTLSDQIAGIKDAQLAEQRNFEDTKYNLDQQHTLAQRNFADEATAATRNHAQLQQDWANESAQRQAMAQQQTINDTRAQWALEDRRQREDAIYTATKSADDLQLKIDQDRQTRLTAQLTDTQSIEALWEKINGFAGASGNTLLTVLPQLADAITQFSNAIGGSGSGGTTRRLGGSVGLARGA